LERTKNIPKGRPKKASRSEYNDSLAVELVHNAFELIMQKQGRPIRITTHSLCQALPTREKGIVWECRKSPLTRSAIKGILDSDISFAQKLITWRLETTNGQSLRFYEAYDGAGLRVLSKKNPEVRRMIEEAFLPT
jgi:hypothetical protein